MSSWIERRARKLNGRGIEFKEAFAQATRDWFEFGFEVSE